MGGFPALMIQQPNVGQDIKNSMELRQMQGAQQLQQQQIQGAQTANQSSQIQLQEQQLDLKDRQTIQSGITSPTLGDDYQKWLQSKGQGSGSSGSLESGDVGSLSSVSPAGVNSLAQFFMETKGLSLKGAQGMTQSIMNNLKSMADLNATNAKATVDRINAGKEQFGNVIDRAEPAVSETDPAKQQSAIDMFNLQVKMSPSDFPPDVVRAVNQNQITSIDTLMPFVNGAKMHDAVIDESAKMAQKQSATADALEKTRNTAGITDEYGVLTPEAQGISDAVKALPALTPAQQAAAQSQLKTAPDMGTLRKSQDLWVSLSGSNQRTQEALANSRAIADMGVQRDVATQLSKLDDARDTSLAGSQNIRAQLDMSKGGNQQATQDAQIAFAGHELRAGGINRISQPEINSLGKDTGSYVRELQAWYAKGSKGEMPAATVSNISDILNLEDKQTIQLHDQQVGNVENRFSQISGGGINPRAAQTNGMIRARDPNGILHEAKAGTPLPAGWKPE